ncbi:MAG: 50S ribosomal protein L18 [bacterium]
MKRGSTKQAKREIRHRRIRSEIEGTSQQPRVSVFRSSQHISAQLIDDENGRTLVHAGDTEIKKEKKSKKTDMAREVGKLLAERAMAAKIKKVVFDRSGYKFHGRVKSLAEGVRGAGLQF